MKETRQSTQLILGFLIFIVIGASLTGIESPEPVIVKTNMHSECFEYATDDDFDNLNGFLQDPQCHDWPYEDGQGESNTPINSVGNSAPYANYFDMTVDLVRYFVGKECNFDLNNCIGTSFENEVQFYCWFSDNIMDNDFGNIFDKFVNANPIGFDDGSFNTFSNTCLVFPPSNMPSTMPNNGDQLNPPIPNNPSGTANGGANMK